MLIGPFDELITLEAGSGMDESDEMGCVHRSTTCGGKQRTHLGDLRGLARPTAASSRRRTAFARPVIVSVRLSLTRSVVISTVPALARPAVQSRPCLSLTWQREGSPPALIPGFEHRSAARPWRVGFTAPGPLS